MRLSRYGICLLLVVVTFFASCEKDFTCTCNIKTTSASGTIFSTERFPLSKHNKKDAKAACAALKYDAVAPGASATYTCSLD